jgi:uncharacterized protein YndB with AHSA1/START domain
VRPAAGNAQCPGRPTTITFVAALLTVRLFGMVQAPPAQVFEVMTDPEQVAEWWGPDGFTCPEVTLDLRVGGAYRIAMQPPDGELFHLTGTYIEVGPPSPWPTRSAGNRRTLTTARTWRALHCAGETAQPRSSSTMAPSRLRRGANCTRLDGPTPSSA